MTSKSENIMKYSNVATRFLCILSQFGIRVIPVSQKTPEKLEELKSEVINIYNNTMNDYNTSLIGKSLTKKCIGVECSNDQKHVLGNY